MPVPMMPEIKIERMNIPGRDIDPIEPVLPLVPDGRFPRRKRSSKSHVTTSLSHHRLVAFEAWSLYEKAGPGRRPMKTAPVTFADLTASVLSVPPLCRRADFLDLPRAEYQASGPFALARRLRLSCMAAMLISITWRRRNSCALPR